MHESTCDRAEIPRLESMGQWLRPRRTERTFGSLMKFLCVERLLLRPLCTSIWCSKLLHLRPRRRAGSPAFEGGRDAFLFKV